MLKYVPIAIFQLRILCGLFIFTGFATTQASVLPDASLEASNHALDSHPHEPGQPNEFWWYWDRPAAQLPPLPPDVGAAVVVKHVYFSGERVIQISRRSALNLPKSAIIIPVVHVEVDPARPFAGSVAQRDALRDAVVNAAQRGHPSWVQLDFEARRSQREFWRASVLSIRARLPAGVRLSVTALASWCYGDRWLGDTPVDEVVPMYFRLGATRAEFVTRSRGGVEEARCASAYGVADDEPPWPVVLSGRRYVFLGHPPRHRAGRSIAEPTP